MAIDKQFEHLLRFNKLKMNNELIISFLKCIFRQFEKTFEDKKIKRIELAHVC